MQLLIFLVLTQVPASQTSAVVCTNITATGEKATAPLTGVAWICGTQLAPDQVLALCRAGQIDPKISFGHVLRTDPDGSQTNEWWMSYDPKSIRKACSCVHQDDIYADPPVFLPCPGFHGGPALANHIPRMRESSGKHATISTIRRIDSGIASNRPMVR